MAQMPASLFPSPPAPLVAMPHGASSAHIFWRTGFITDPVRVDTNLPTFAPLPAAIPKVAGGALPAVTPNPALNTCSDSPGNALADCQSDKIRTINKDLSFMFLEPSGKCRRVPL